MPRVRATGSAAPARYGGHRRPVLEPYHADLEQLVAALPDITLAERKRSWSAAWAWSSGSQPCTTLSAASASGIKKSVEAAEQDRPDVAQKRRLGGPGNASGIRRGSSSSTRPAPPRTWRAAMAAARPARAWSPPCRMATGGPIVAGLRQSGIVAPLVLDGPMTGSAFRAYVEQFVAPALAPGDVVVLDHLAAHKVTASARSAVRSPRPAPRSSTCRPTARISRLAPSTDLGGRCGAARRSSSCPPSSRRCCARPPRAPRRE